MKKILYIGLIVSGVVAFIWLFSGIERERSNAPEIEVSGQAEDKNLLLPQMKREPAALTKGEPRVLASRPVSKEVKKGFDGDQLRELNAVSEGQWRVTKRGEYISRMADSSINLGQGSATKNAAEFLERYGSGLLGVSSQDLYQDEIRDEGRTIQIIYKQQVGGIPVYNSRINMIFDKSGALIYLLSDAYTQNDPAPVAYMPIEKALPVVRDALVSYLESRGVTVADDAYPIDFLSSHVSLVYRLMAGNISLVYHYSLPIQEDGVSDIEVFQEARTGEIAGLKPISRH